MAAWVLEPKNPPPPVITIPPLPSRWTIKGAVSLNLPSVANRNLNPLNLKWGAKTRRYVDLGLASISDIIPADGGRFLKFDDAETGFRAAAELLHSYGDLELDGALRKWSNAGYGGGILAGTALDAKTPIADLRRGDLTVVLHAMAAAEGYRSPTIVDEISKALKP